MTPRLCLRAPLAAALFALALFALTLPGCAPAPPGGVMQAGGWLDDGVFGLASRTNARVQTGQVPRDQAPRRRTLSAVAGVPPAAPRLLNGQYGEIIWQSYITGDGAGGAPTAQSVSTD
jgi:hypothetical protein